MQTSASNSLGGLTTVRARRSRSERSRGGRTGGSDEETARLVDVVADALEVAEGTVGVGVLDEAAAVLLGGEVGGGGIADDDLNALELGTHLDAADHLGVAVGGDEELGSLLAAVGVGHLEGLGGGGGVIEEGGVGDGETGEVGDHGLVVQESLETALRMKGRRRGVPGRFRPGRGCSRCTSRDSRERSAG